MASTDTGFGKVRFFDDFTDDTLDTFKWTVNGDGGSTITIIEAPNGEMRLTTDGTNGDIQNLFGAEIWKPSVSGTVVFEARVGLLTSITQGVFVGLSDDNDADEVPIDLDTGSLTTTAADAVGFVYDSQENGNWHICSVKADADGAQTDTGVAVTLGVYQTLRIVVETNGNCRFFIDGKEVTASGAARSAAITTTTQYCAAIAQLASGTASTVAIDYVFCEGGRS